MGVRVFTSKWDQNVRADVTQEHVYSAADSWNLRTEKERVFLEVTDSENDRVVALFDCFDHVEVDDEEDD